jgi:tetratricopeptide (TPR) repeat protein
MNCTHSLDSVFAWVTASLTHTVKRGSVMLLLLALAACTVQPYRPSQPVAKPAPQPQPTPPGVEIQPALPQEPPAPSQPLPAPTTRSFSLNAASRALVNQAHTQLAAKNFGMAASTIERALRIEPNNPLLWLEYAQVRMTEGNYVQAESMGRRALALAGGDPRAQANSWHLISESLLAQNKTTEARQAEMRANGLSAR